MLRRNVYNPLLGLALGAAVPARGEEIDVFVLEVHGPSGRAVRRSRCGVRGV